MRTGLLAVAAFLAAVPAAASTDALGDGDLVARANAVRSAKDGPVDRILGVHKGAQVFVDVRCSDVCPAYTVRIIHYMIGPGPGCTQLGGDVAAVAVPVGIATMNQDFCIPHVLYQRKLYVDRPYQN
jgi:hypothetical protein